MRLCNYSLRIFFFLIVIPGSYFQFPIPLSAAPANIENKQGKEKMKILIVGGGIAGLATANALKNYQIPFDLIEKRKTWKREGTGIALPANATWALEKLGLSNEIHSLAYPIQAMSFVTDQQELLTKEIITKIHHDGAQFLSIHRADLHSILLKKLDPSMIHMGTTIESIRQTSKGLEIEFNDHSQKIYDLVIGADGIHSKVRQLAFNTDPLVYQGIANWRTVIDTPSGLDHPIYMLGDTTVFLLYPINNNKTYIYAHSYEPIPPKDNPEERAKRLKTLFKHFKGYVPEALEQINNSQKIVFGLLESVPEIAWVRGDVILIGDASHGCSPMLQQGGAQALEDGLVLGEELNKGLKNNENIAVILQNFVHRRHVRVEHIVRESDKRIKILPSLRNEHIKKNGAPNVAMFKVIMKTNP